MCYGQGLPLPGDGTVEALRAAVELRQPGDLTKFLAGFAHTAPALAGDPAAVERVAREFCEDAAHNGLLYVEARFCPHLLLGEGGSVTPDQIVEAALQGFQAGQASHGLTARLILCCIRGLSQFSEDILRLCEKYRGQGVVGIDIAGDEEGLSPDDPEMFDEVTRSVFSRAVDLGIHRTAHAGEVGPAKCVQQALDTLHVERVGHGYRVLEDEQLYQRCLREQVHFETCPTSSILTGAQPLEYFYHAVAKFADDQANFSINTDDSMVTGTWTQQEYELLTSWGLTEAQLVRSNINALKASFLEPAEKEEMLEKLYKALGVDV